MVIETTVNLTSGKKNVKAYYLDEDDKRFLYSLTNEITQHRYSFNRVANEMVILREVFHENLVEYYKPKILDIITHQYKDKSFHASDLWFSTAFHKERTDAFQRLVEEGIVVECGSGWYRLNEGKS